MRSLKSPPSITSVRTHSTRRSSATSATHELYLKLTALAIEHKRRTIERTACEERISMIDNRLDAIRQEREEVQQLLAPSLRDEELDKPASKGSPASLKY